MNPNEQQSTAQANLWNRLDNIRRWLQGFFFGMTYFEMVKTLRKERSDREHLFVLISFGDLIGVPILPPYYSLRLLLGTENIQAVVHVLKTRYLSYSSKTDNNSLIYLSGLFLLSNLNNIIKRRNIINNETNKLDISR